MPPDVLKLCLKTVQGGGAHAGYSYAFSSVLCLSSHSLSGARPTKIGGDRFWQGIGYNSALRLIQSSAQWICGPSTVLHLQRLSILAERFAPSASTMRCRFLAILEALHHQVSSFGILMMLCSLGAACRPMRPFPGKTELKSSPRMRWSSSLMLSVLARRIRSRSISRPYSISVTIRGSIVVLNK